MSSTLFVAALFHGVIILGVTFSSEPVEDGDALPTLRITLVADSAVDEVPDDPDFLAPRSRVGSGQLAEGDRPTTTPGRAAPENRSGDPASAANREGQPRQNAPGADLLLTRNPSDRRLDAVPRPNEAPAERRETLSELIAEPVIATAALELDSTATLSENEVRELLASPSTRQSSVAAYLNAWRNRVELIGTRNFPPQARTRDSLNPTLEVAIDADGDLVDVVVRRSSGNSSLDQAALMILRLAAPFQPLPDEVRAEYDVLRFAYEWDFDEG
ncbi:MAG TPA: TonB family protein [Gammaproteobacteria bacterium]